MAHIALIAGATGLTGGLCLDRLLASRAYESVIALVRRPSGISGEQIVDFDNLSALEVPANSDVFCALGTTIRKAGSQEHFRRVDLDYPVALAKRAAACRARQFLVMSSAGADASSTNFYLRTKGEMEQSIIGLPFYAVHVFRPSLLLGKRAEFRPGERVGAALSPAMSVLLVGSLRRYRPISAEQVARAMCAAAWAGAEGPQVYEYDGIRALAR
jgi:uncharacterized protein YbjT (DUF2867 family)